MSLGEDEKPRKKIKKPCVVDLFCGAGGLSYGFEMAGFNILLGIDNDKAALQSFEYNHRDSKSICGDITKITYKNIVSKIGKIKIDVIVGGPPCQGMSLSGPRKFDDPRNKLYLSYIRLVKEIQPKIFIIENVPGLVGLFNGEIKNNIIKRFTNLGYKINYEILCSSDYGVPQFRKRVIFIGYKKGKFVYPKKNNKQISCIDALSDLPPLVEETGGENIPYYTKPKSEYQKLMRKNSRSVSNHIAAKHSDIVKKTISLIPAGGNYKNLPKDFNNTRNFHVAWTRFPDNKPAPTIDTGHRHHFHYMYNRVPTVRECARIQSFPDDFIFFGNKTQQFRQVGNAVPPLMAKRIAIQVKKLLAQAEEK